MRKIIMFFLILIASVFFGGIHFNVKHIDEIDMIKFHAYGCMKRFGLTIGKIKVGKVDCALPFTFVPRGTIIEITREQASIACKDTFKSPYDVNKFDIKNDIWTCAKFTRA